MAVVNEHPNQCVRTLYAGEIAAKVGLPVSDLVRLAERGTRRPHVEVRSPARSGPMENAEFAALVLLVQQWDSIAEWLIEALFDDDANRMAFLALADAGGVHAALEQAAPDAREVLERAAVADLALDPTVEAQSLIAAATRRELRHRSERVDPAALEEDRAAKLDLMALAEADGPRALAAAESLLGWLHRRTAERSEGPDA